MIFSLSKLFEHVDDCEIMGQVLVRELWDVGSLVALSKFSLSVSASQEAFSKRSKGDNCNAELFGSGEEAVLFVIERE